MHFPKNRSRIAIAKAALDAVLSDVYLNGRCCLQEIIEKDYLQLKFKANTHITTKATHILNELWSSEFLKGSLKQIHGKETRE